MIRVLSSVVALMACLVWTPAFAGMSTEDAFLADMKQMHQENCSKGAKGWWVTLTGGTHKDYGVQGGIDRSTGKFSGCGSCAQCRQEVEGWIPGLKEADGKACTARGGRLNHVIEGKIIERIQETQWAFVLHGFQTFCQKWVPC